MKSNKDHKVRRNMIATKNNVISKKTREMIMLSGELRKYKRAAYTRQKLLEEKSKSIREKNLEISKLQKELKKTKKELAHFKSNTHKESKTNGN